MGFNKSQIKLEENFVVKNTKNIDLNKFENINQLFEYSFQKYSNRVAFMNMAYGLKFKDLDKYSKRFASFLLNKTDLRPGDKVVLQMPNILAYPVAAVGILRAGMVIVNANPLYTEREMEHQFKDSGAKAIVASATVGQRLQHILPRTDIKHTIIANVADMHPPFKRKLLNWVVKNVKKAIPHYNLPYAISFRKALRLGKDTNPIIPHIKQNDIACLQYTGGTTGVAKGASLTHKNLLANLLQSSDIIADHLARVENPILVSPLPLYHIYSFMVSFMAPIYLGYASLFITDPRNTKMFVKVLSSVKFQGFVGINTLFTSLLENEEFRGLDFTQLRVCMSGGMALTANVADKWFKVTGMNICEGYGMTETSPIVLANPVDDIQIGTIGFPIANTEAKIVDEEYKTLPFGEVGEICVKGPQVMQGYWQRDDETKKVLEDDGFLHTGDIAMVEKDGRFRIVDRKKDTINVSGFNVYPNEVEEVLLLHPEILEAAVVGVEDKRSGEAGKAFLVTRNQVFTSRDARRWCEERLAAYKVPKYYEFRKELPKTAVGKVLRRELRDS